ncbi:kelch domain-containing protein 7A [Hyperolius riggenbachi]|uniref:kelch domain-containing protein 7A n=1 Tax=Hyperolius riggenbachi TaxID=752182 RepID=UPI0035A3C882
MINTVCESRVWQSDMQLVGKVALSAAALFLLALAYRFYKFRALDRSEKADKHGFGPGHAEGDVADIPQRDYFDDESGNLRFRRVNSNLQNGLVTDPGDKHLTEASLETNKLHFKVQEGLQSADVICKDQNDFNEEVTALLHNNLDPLQSHGYLGDDPTCQKDVLDGKETTETTEAEEIRSDHCREDPEGREMLEKSELAKDYSETISKNVTALSSIALSVSHHNATKEELHRFSSTAEVQMQDSVVTEDGGPLRILASGGLRGKIYNYHVESTSQTFTAVKKSEIGVSSPQVQFSQTETYLTKLEEVKQLETSVKGTKKTSDEVNHDKNSEQKQEDNISDSDTNAGKIRTHIDGEPKEFRSVFSPFKLQSSPLILKSEETSEIRMSSQHLPPLETKEDLSTFEDNTDATFENGVCASKSHTKKYFPVLEEKPEETPETEVWIPQSPLTDVKIDLPVKRFLPSLEDKTQETCEIRDGALRSLLKGDVPTSEEKGETQMNVNDHIDIADGHTKDKIEDQVKLLPKQDLSKDKNKEDTITVVKAESPRSKNVAVATTIPSVLNSLDQSSSPAVSRQTGPGTYHVSLGPESTFDIHVDLGNCYEVLCLAKKHNLDSLKSAAYKAMSNEYLQVLQNPSVFGRLNVTERDLILEGRMKGRRFVAVADIDTQALCTSQNNSSLSYYDNDNDVWIPLSKIPTEAVSRGSTMATMFNYLFVVLGCDGPERQMKPSKRVLCYNPLTDSWKDVSPLKEARPHCKLVALDGYLYAIGGECLHTVERYDPRQNRWSYVAPLPNDTFAVAHMATAYDDEIFVTGGTLRYMLLRYRERENQWKYSAISGSKDRTTEIVACNNFLYRFDLNRSMGISVHRCNIRARIWYECATHAVPYPVPFQCAVIDNSIYCISRNFHLRFLAEDISPRFMETNLQTVPSPKGLLFPFVLVLPPKATE